MEMEEGAYIYTTLVYPTWELGEGTMVLGINGIIPRLDLHPAWSWDLSLSRIRLERKSPSSGGRGHSGMACL
jgi:hypothetical protein